MTTRAKFCRYCGQPFAHGAIIGLHPNTVKGQVYDMIASSGSYGIESKKIFDTIYGRRRDGGPTTGIKIVHVLVNHINRLLKPHKKVVRNRGNAGGRQRGFAIYYLAPLK